MLILYTLQRPCRRTLFSFPIQFPHFTLRIAGTVDFPNGISYVLHMVGALVVVDDGVAVVVVGVEVFWSVVGFAPLCWSAVPWSLCFGPWSLVVGPWPLALGT